MDQSVLRIFGRDAWLPQADSERSTLTLSLRKTTARVHVLAKWDVPGSMESEAYFCQENSNAWLRPLMLHRFSNGLFSKWETSNSDEEMQLSSPYPPDRVELGQLEVPVFSTMASIMPRCVAAAMPAASDAQAGIDFVSIVKDTLRDDGLSSALKLFTYSRSGIPSDQVVAAAREILIHLARYPLQRDPLLGAFLASLCTEAADR
jgi:hypothetical protein